MKSLLDSYELYHNLSPIELEEISMNPIKSYHQIPWNTAIFAVKTCAETPGEARSGAAI